MTDGNGAGFLGSLRFRYGLVLIGFLAVAGYFLWQEHEAHILSALPIVLVLGLCLGMHFFMHGGHGGGHGGGHDHGNDSAPRDRQGRDGGS
jgi:hypothetical protein